VHSVFLFSAKCDKIIQGVPLATETDISLIILTPMKILQRNLNRSTFVVGKMKRNVSVVRLIVATRSSGPPACLGSVASGTHCFGFGSEWDTLYKTLNILYSLFYSDCNEHNLPKPILLWAKPTVIGTKAMQRNFVNNVK